MTLYKTVHLWQGMCDTNQTAVVPILRILPQSAQQISWASISRELKGQYVMANERPE